MNNNKPIIEKRKKRSRFLLRFVAIVSFLLGIAVSISSARMYIEFFLFSKGVQKTPDGINITLNLAKYTIGLTMALAVILIVDAILMWCSTRKPDSEDEKP
jgi:formate hydrogenlyase subunit 3/multisubunit Na+/H+ antiporter MnhD subunit